MLRKEAFDQYTKALKMGQKCYRNAIVEGKYPYPQVLDEILDDSMVAGRVDMGLVEIPIDQIVGTKEAGRKSAFAADFMPLLPAETEFGVKWIQLCMAHLGDEGIRDPIRCYEYLGRFYVEEGNKRVSVLKSYEASMVHGYVTRVIPAYSEDLSVQVYYEFMRFHQLSGLYQVNFQQLGAYAKLQAALGFDADHVWTQEERQSFLSGFSRFREFFTRQGGEALGVTVADALLVWLRIYSFDDLKIMTASDLNTSLTRVWADVKLQAEEEPITINTEPDLAEKSRWSFLSNRPTHLNVAFLFHASPSTSAFTRSHELGSEYVASRMSSSVTVRNYYGVRADEAGEGIMEKAIAEGAQVLFATAPPLIGNCRKVASRHPEVRILNCSLSMPYVGVRTYYSRVHESKFITGAVAAAMAQEDRIGYVANYPIFGVPASINAFALGARMVNPNVKIQVEWSCLPGNLYQKFRENGVRVITNREIPSPENVHWSWDWGTYQLLDDGSSRPLASPCWDWGKFYEKVLMTILTGTWDNLASREGDRAVSYWWGMNSGVVDVQLSPDLPVGVQQLAKILKNGVMDGSIDPFHCRMVDQMGNVVNDGDSWLSPAEIMHMDWLLDCVEGSLPAFDDLLPMSQNLVRVFGVYRDQIPPEKKGVLL